MLKKSEPVPPILIKPDQLSYIMPGLSELYRLSLFSQRFNFVSDGWISGPHHGSIREQSMRHSGKRFEVTAGIKLDSDYRNKDKTFPDYALEWEFVDRSASRRALNFYAPKFNFLLQSREDGLLCLQACKLNDSLVTAIATAMDVPGDAVTGQSVDSQFLMAVMAANILHVQGAYDLGQGVQEYLTQGMGYALQTVQAGISAHGGAEYRDLFCLPHTVEDQSYLVLDDANFFPVMVRLAERHAEQAGLTGDDARHLASLTAESMRCDLALPTLNQSLEKLGEGLDVPRLEAPE